MGAVWSGVSAVGRRAAPICIVQSGAILGDPSETRNASTAAAKVNRWRHETVAALYPTPAALCSLGCGAERGLNRHSVGGAMRVKVHGHVLSGTGPGAGLN